MEFKGTKEKWQVDENLIFADDYFQTHIAVLSSESYGTVINKANALLISKAPELLEMLQKVVLMTETCNGTFEDFRERYNIEIKQLIKEATEL